jgi:hypothetical protein
VFFTQTAAVYSKNHKKKPKVKKVKFALEQPMKAQRVE